jgi:hypothetical protein
MGEQQWSGSSETDGTSGKRSVFNLARTATHVYAAQKLICGVEGHEFKSRRSDQKIT